MAKRRVEGDTGRAIQLIAQRKLFADAPAEARIILAGYQAIHWQAVGRIEGIGLVLVWER